MRLTEREQHAIKSAVSNHFGEDARVWLFGSRVDDTRRGGDIDLRVETTLTGEDALRAKIDTITDIQLAIGDQKIDLVVDDPAAQSAGDEPPLVITNARREGVPL